MPAATVDGYPQGHGGNHFQALLKSLDGTTGGRKRKQSDPLDIYTSAARFFPLNFDPFVDFRSVLRNGIAAEYEEQAESPSAEVYQIRLYNDWMKTVPGFSDVIIKFETNPDALDEFIDAMGVAANGALTDDTGSLKLIGLDYVLKDPLKDKIEPPIPRSRHSTKADLGWNNQTNLMKIPSEAYMDLVRSGSGKKPSATKFPSLLYDMDLFDPNDKRSGFLCDHALVQTWHHIFTGPASAFDKTRQATKPPKGRIHGLQEPNIRNFMYAAVQIYFTLSNEESWATMIGTVDLTDMYYSVVDMIERKSDERWVKDLMEFWKDGRVLYSAAPGLSLGGPSKRRKIISTPTSSDSEDDLAGFEDPPNLESPRCPRTQPPTRNCSGEDDNDGDGSPVRRPVTPPGPPTPDPLPPLTPPPPSPPLPSPPPTSPPPPQSPSPADKRRKRAKPAPAPRPPSKRTRKK
ncbi:hypothetical protein BU15DRAFT_70818 [Melanogaster broomeanus]|nr:hypothetical protein BU15DRAFT_70818 [Melanogaster broomeanus]